MLDVLSCWFAVWWTGLKEWYSFCRQPAQLLDPEDACAADMTSEAAREAGLEGEEQLMAQAVGGVPCVDAALFSQLMEQVRIPLAAFRLVSIDVAAKFVLPASTCSNTWGCA